MGGWTRRSLGQLSTYVIFTSVEDYAEFDRVMATDNTLFAGMADQEREVFERFGLETLQSPVTNRFRLDPGRSYVDAATKAWIPPSGVATSPSMEDQPITWLGESRGKMGLDLGGLAASSLLAARHLSV